MEDTPSEDETIPDVYEKRMMFIGIGAVGIILGIFLSAIWGGFGVVDEFMSQDWTETDSSRSNRILKRTSAHTSSSTIMK